jgi:hypothetical protein
MRTVEQASVAMKELEGKSMYQSSLFSENVNFMRIQYSQLPELDISQTNERAKDYTQGSGITEPIRNFDKNA